MPKPGWKPSLTKLAANLEIGHQGEAEARAHRRALDRRHDRLLGREQAHRLLVERIDPRHARAADAGGRGQIRPGAERLAGGAQNADAQGLVGVDIVQGVGQVAHQLDADEIIRRPINLQQGHMPLNASGNLSVLVFHQVNSDS